MKKARLTLTMIGALAFVVGGSATAFAQTYKADPFTFVGTSAQCTPSPAGSRIVYSGWLNGMGLPDSITQPHPDGKNPHQGLLLNKNGPTPDCSAPGATIVGFVAGTSLNALGFDYRLGGHCGAGAPRFNVVQGTTTYFFGCFSGDASPAPQDPAQWERKTFTGPVGTPSTYPGSAGFIWGSAVDAIHIIYDEGTDTPGSSDPAGVGLATLDNIRINNTFITKKNGNAIQP